MLTALVALTRPFTNYIYVFTLERSQHAPSIVQDAT